MKTNKKIQRAIKNGKSFMWRKRQSGSLSEFMEFVLYAKKMNKNYKYLMKGFDSALPISIKKGLDAVGICCGEVNLGKLLIEFNKDGLLATCIPMNAKNMKDLKIITDSMINSAEP